ncbi:MAG: nitroreductase family protein [Rickettsiales bacterium]|jgi:nitroreductase|nr:nitroreductase family protein [Rickettsiales bacterium]
MKTKIIIGLVAVLVILGVVAYAKFGFLLHNARALPTPSVDDGVLALIDARMSSRNFSDREMDAQTTSDILWAAFGKNSHGTRTIPTAMNEQDLKVYAIRADGAYFYDGGKLVQITDTDLRPLFAQQKFVLDAPLTLLYVGPDAEYSRMHAGSAYQNVALYCAERGLACVVRGMFDKAGTGVALGLESDEVAIISQTVGWPK